MFKPEIPTIAEAVTRYFEDATARQLSSATIQKQKILIEKRLLAWAESKGYRLLKQLDVDSLRQFRATWPDGALSACKNLERLRAFFRFCETSGWTRGSNPARAVKPPKVTPNPTLPFTKAEMRKIVAACDEYPGRNSFRHDNRARVRAFVMLLRYSGLRIRDAATLRRDRLQGSKLFLYQQKTGTPVYVPLPPQAVDALTALNTDNEYFFWTGNGNPKTVVADWQRSLGRVFMLANIQGGHAHRFRDTFAVELLLGGVPIDQVSVLLGHSSVKITEKHYSPWVKARQQKLEQLVKQAWSRS